MKWFLVSIKDNAIEAWQPPSIVRHPGEATRRFTDAVNNPQNVELGAHCEDYDLYHIGYWYDDTAKVEMLPEPARIMRGKDAKLKND